MTIEGPTNVFFEVPEDVYLKEDYSKEVLLEGASIQLGLDRKASSQLMHPDEQAKRVHKAKGQAQLAQNNSELA
ncbi:hypothetical protein V6N11_013846 [Hibiscus sabdariffa]|uniref:Uncharacterized protein n=2 Tax=Hibiscus sabdariffa TaxID=183260 RepID=A0ABR2NA75_9ROSI